MIRTLKQKVPIRAFRIALFLSVLIIATTTAAAQTEIRLSTWYTGATEAVLRQIIDEFERDNPDYVVSIEPTGGPTDMFEQVLVQAAAGVPPDLTMTQHGMEEGLFNTGIFEDLRPWIERDLPVADYFPELIRFWNANSEVAGDGQYALPLVSYAQSLFFNVDLFEENGLESPISLHDRGAWDKPAFEQAARAITRPETDTYGFTMNPDWIWGIFVHNHGGRLYNEDASATLITSSAVVDTVQWQADLMNVQEIAVWDTWDHQHFANGRGGMFITAAWMSDILNETTLNYDAAPIFYTDEPRPHQSPSGDGIAMLAASANKEGAWRLMKHLMSPDAQTRLATIGIPVHGDVARDPVLFTNRTERPHNYMAFVYELAEKTATFYPAGIPSEAGSMIGDAVWSVFTGDASAATALGGIEDAVNAILTQWHTDNR